MTYEQALKLTSALRRGRGIDVYVECDCRFDAIVVRGPKSKRRFKIRFDMASQLYVYWQICHWLPAAEQASEDDLSNRLCRYPAYVWK